ncbi:MAG: hypothetical protein J5863_05820 [Desulfovibrio sp.]|nr:hypothetical protein [Desulfovibrio sp.]MBR5049756.1 hypothetical protein [Desulfovibrio sp.]
MKLHTSFAALASCLLLLGGCGSSTGAASDKGCPAVPGKKDACITTAGDAPDDVKAGLRAAAQDLTGRAGRTVMPNKNKPQFRTAGKEHIARYITVDQGSVHCQVRKGQNAHTPYTGLISYDEVTMECRGATKAEAAKSTNCKSVGSASRKELIRYDGKTKKWVF